MHTHDDIQMFKNTTHKVQRITDTSRLHERQHIHEEDDTSKGIISSFQTLKKVGRPLTC